MNLFKEPTVVKKATPEATVVPPEQKVSPPPRGRVSISMPFIVFFFLFQLFSFSVSQAECQFILFCV